MWQSTGMSAQKLNEEEEKGGSLEKRGQKGRLQRAAVGTKYLIRLNDTHVVMTQSCKKTMSIIGRTIQLDRSRLGTCKSKCGHFQS